MIIDCQITKVFKDRSGVSQAGKPYNIQPIEIAWQEAKRNNSGETFVVEHSVAVDLMGDYAKNFSLKVGDYISIDIRFSTNEFKEKMYNRITSNYLILRSA